MSQKKAIIELRHVEKDFGAVKPLKDIDVTIYQGDIIGIIGPSGCGKSTLLRCINQLDPPTGGDILLEGQSLLDRSEAAAAAQKRIGMVFQRFNLFSHWTVAENIMKPQMLLLGRSKQAAYDRAMELLDKVGLADKELAFPEELSGGQQQRIAIARTLAMDPEIILFDEPTSALDPQNVGEVKRVIMDLAKTGVTMLIVSHDMRFVRTVAKRVFFLDEGIVFEEGDPLQIFERPQRKNTQAFIFRAKTSTFDITRRNFDFPGMVAWVDGLGEAYHLPFSVIDRIQHAVEELVMEILMPELPEQPKIRLIFRYEEDEGLISIRALYNGELFSPFESDNELAKQIIQSVITSAQHEPYQGEGFTNSINLAGLFK